MKRHALSLQQCLPRSRPYICHRCQQQRNISQMYLKRKEEGRQQWAERAKEIRAKTRKSMLETLKDRGYINAIAGEEKALDRLMTDKRVGAYVGVDPTARSLHVGHLVAFMPLFWMFIHGFHAVTLIGGSTARIGDPTGRTTDRPDMTPTERKANIASVHFQLKRLWVQVERMARKHGYEPDKNWQRDIVNNAVWWNKLPFLDVLKLLGKGLRLGPMLSRDTVKTKMESGDGISFAEFCYPILQSWDWWQMYEERGVQMQIGGADQFGNIVSGIDAIKYMAKTHPNPDIRQESGVQELTMPYGITVPLLTTASGAKFGKSAGNAIWLDQDMTSVFDLYGFFIRTADADVEKYLKLFTFLPLNQIQSLMDQHKLDQSKRIPHHRLAFEFVDLVHGPQSAKEAELQHRTFFSKLTVSSLIKTKTTDNVAQNDSTTQDQDATKHTLGTALSSSLDKFAAQANAQSSPVENIVLPKSLIYDQPIARILFAAGLVSSRSEGHRLAQAGGAYIGAKSSGTGNEQMGDDLIFRQCLTHDQNQAWKWVIRDSEESGEMEKEGEEGILILRVGKWKVRIVRVVSDEKFDSFGIPEPQAWREFKAAKAAHRQEATTNEVIAEVKQQSRAQRIAAKESMDEEEDDSTFGATIKDDARVIQQPLDDLHDDNFSYAKSIGSAPEAQQQKQRLHKETPPEPDLEKARAEYGSVRPTSPRTATALAPPLGKREQFQRATALQQSQGKLAMEQIRLQDLTKAAKDAGHDPNQDPALQDREHKFIAAKLESQTRYVRSLAKDVKDRELRVAEGLGGAATRSFHSNNDSNADQRATEPQHTSTTPSMRAASTPSTSRLSAAPRQQVDSNRTNPARPWEGRGRQRTPRQVGHGRRR